MSSSYTLEPVTKGKVVLRTTLGDIEIELWPKEAPKAVRNFVQLCLEGFYDGCPFHRVVKDFIVQTGDPKGDGGESIYGEPFLDEFHQRLRFLRRGLVAMANSGPNTNLSQFFITLNKTEELNGKNTIFGKVVGDTIFNVLKVNDMEVVDEQLALPQRILSVDVLASPFDDIVPRQKAIVPKQPAAAAATTGNKPAAKGPAAKNLSLLSFADDAEEPEEEPVPTATKGKSAYHFLEDERIQRELKAQEKEREEMRARVAAAAAAAQAAAAAAAEAAEAAKKQEKKPVSASDFAASMRERLKEKKRALESGDAAPNEEEEQLRREILEMHKKRAEEDDDDEPRSYIQAQRAKYLAKKKVYGSYVEKQKAIAARVESFKAALKAKAPATAAAKPSEETAPAVEAVEEDWKTHELKFEAPEMKKTTVDAVLKAAEAAEEQYVVYDPLSGKVPTLGVSRHKQVLVRV